jgi:hypothetical protein
VGDSAVFQELVSGLSTRRPGFDPMSVHEKFIFDRVLVVQNFIPVLPIYPLSVIITTIQYLSFITEAV